MRARNPLFVAIATALLAAGGIAPGHAEDVNLDDPPVAVSVGLPQGSGTELNDDPVAATGDVVLAARSKATCTTQAFPPRELDLFDPTHISGNAEIRCGDASYDAIISAHLLYYGSNPNGPVGDGTYLDSVTVYDFTPATASAKIDKLTAKIGWYRTKGASKVIYPYTLDHRKPAGQGCKYLYHNATYCQVASSYVYIHPADVTAMTAADLLPTSD